MCRAHYVARAALILITASLALNPAPSAAQDCELKVRPVRGILGYGPRPTDTRCEGMYVELQSTPVALRVVSLLRGSLPFGAENADRLDMHTSLNTLPLDNAVTILAQPTQAGVNWALDVRVSVGAPGRDERPGPRRVLYKWHKAEIFDRTDLALRDIGFVARITSRVAPHDPLYVPLAVTLPGGTISDDPLISVVFHLSGASAARLCVPGDSCVVAEALRSPAGYFDGFFAADLPISVRTGEVLQVVVQWRESDSIEVRSDRFDVLRW